MYFPKCGKGNPDDAELRCSFGCALAETSVATKSPTVKTSRLAIVSLGLGVFSVCTFGVTAIPAAILAVISRLKIEKSGGRLTGEGFAVVGIAVSVVLLFVAGVAMPALSRARWLSFRLICGKNLSGLGKSMLIYANDYDDELPRAGGRNSTWSPSIANWQGRNRRAAFGLAADGSGGHANISSSFYLLVKYAEVAPKSFVCPGDPGVVDFRLSEYDAWNITYIDLWDFGPNPAEHCSYSYHVPYGLYPLTTAKEPGMAVAGDRNPWIDAPAVRAKEFSLFDWDGDQHQQRAGNAIAHLENGQNVLFMDIHVAFEKRAFCAIVDDNIYTFSAGPPKQQGSPPVVGESQPQNRLDSLLVQDGDHVQTPPRR
ncbi:MAG: DUF4190 domain-containing protein [Planctomycetes bacterium]|nr:DUF4190 domain-containing protein [Planctomycetota bacterium]